MASGALLRVAGLEDARSDEHALGAELHHHGSVCRGGDAAGGEHGDRQLAGLGDLDDQFVRGLQFLGGYVQFVLAQRGQPADLAADGAHVSGGVGDVSGACFTLRADHGRAFVDATERFAEVGGATDEGSGELPLVDVVGVVGRGQDLGLVDVVDAEALQDLRFDEVTDACLGP